MDNDEFSKCYSAIIDVLLAKIPSMAHMTRSEVDETVNKILSFA